MKGTRGELNRRLRRLLVIGAVFCAALAASYHGVHDDAVPLAQDTAPAVLAVDTAQDALRRANEDAEQGAAGSDDFQTRMSIASQSLELAATKHVTGSSGRQTLQTVVSLISVYYGWVQRANAEPEPLHTAYLGYAENMLQSHTVPEAGIMGKLDSLRGSQAEVVERQSGHGPRRALLWAGWAVVLVSGLALLAALLETQRYLRGRFRRRWNRPLLAAGALLVLGTAALTRLTWQAGQHLSAARAALTGRQEGDGIHRTGEQVARLLHEADRNAALGNAVLAGSLLLVGLLVAGLLPRLREYPAQPVVPKLPAPRTLAAVGLCLALLAGGVTVGITASRGHGSVTLLANWSRQDEQSFRRTVIAPFEAKYHIHVNYQGSSAESKVLAADTETGTAPDVAVLPGPGELAGYAVHGQLTPLEDLIDTDDFAAIWAPRLTRPHQHDAHVYWVPVKADVKSLVWHPAALSDGQVAGAAGRPGGWCLGMGSGATSGWPGTDWVEDILLHQAGSGYYQRWATGRQSWTHSPALERAFTTWGRLVGAGDRDHARRALTTDYGDAPRGLTRATDPCSLEHAGTFVRNDGDWRRARARYTPSAALVPGADARYDDTWEVSSDLAAVLHDTPQSRRLIAYLASPAVQRAWSLAEHSLFASRRVPLGAYGHDRIARSIADRLGEPSAGRCWDASDAMPPAMRDAFTRATLRYLAAPGELDGLLATLEKVRQRALKDGTWLTSVCG